MMAAQSSTPRMSPPAYEIREADGREDAFYLVRQWHHYFGVEYAPNRLPWELHEPMGWENDDNPHLAACCLVAEHGDVAIGGGVASLLDHEETVDELPSGRYDCNALAGSRNAFLWLGVVDPAWRGRGIGRALFRSRLRWARAYGADMVFAYGWERREGRSSRPLFEAHDFVPIQRFPDYYADESARTACPDCGCWPSDDRPCRCEMTLWSIDGGDLDVE